MTTKQQSGHDDGAIKQETRKIEPVLVSVGKPLLPHQTPIYPWQIDSEAGKQLMRQDSPELLLNFTGKNSELLQSMYDYTIVPSDKIKKRMDYFYTPYNQQFLLRKHMTFEDADHQNQQVAQPERPPPQKSGLEDILERIAAAKKPEIETDKLEPKPCIRDRTFTKDELSGLEKKKWIEIKDIIFETDSTVLNYLSWHCKRWRKTIAGELETANLSKRKKIGKPIVNSQTTQSRSFSQTIGAGNTMTITKKLATAPLARMATFEMPKINGEKVAQGVFDGTGIIEGESIDENDEFISTQNHVSLSLDKKPKLQQNRQLTSDHSHEQKPRKEVKVVVPEKCSANSQFIVRQRAKEAMQEKEAAKKLASKKFVRSDLNKSKLNGVLQDSSRAQSSLIKKRPNNFGGDELAAKIRIDYAETDQMSKTVESINDTWQRNQEITTKTSTASSPMHQKLKKAKLSNGMQKFKEDSNIRQRAYPQMHDPSFRNSGGLVTTTSINGSQYHTPVKGLVNVAGERIDFETGDVINTGSPTLSQKHRVAETSQQKKRVNIYAMSPFQLDARKDKASHVLKANVNQRLALNEFPMVSFSNQSTRIHSPKTFMKEYKPGQMQQQFFTRSQTSQTAMSSGQRFSKNKDQIAEKHGLKEKEIQSLLNESYTTAITASPIPHKKRALNHNQLNSEARAVSPGIRESHDLTINEYPASKLPIKQRLYTPSRVKLGMYKQTLVLDPPRRALESLGRHPNRAIYGEKMTRNQITMTERFKLDYATSRPGPTIMPRLLRKRGKSLSASQKTDKSLYLVSAI